MASEMQGILERLALEEGGLVEICIENTSFADWDVTFDALAAGGYVALEQQAGTGVRKIAPNLFTDGEELTSPVSVRVGRQKWTTQFYSARRVDFQGEPGGIKTTGDLLDIQEFMQLISKATGKVSRFIPEAIDVDRVKPYFSVFPDGLIRY